MGFRNILGKLRSVMLCCRADERNQALEIGLPTDVRRGAWTMPGLTKEEEDFIREKASASAANLLSLTSHPPTQPPSPPASQPPSLASSRSTSTALLNSASAKLPATLPTPPRQQHSDSNLPANLPPSAHTRMKGFWERKRRLSNTLSINSHHSGYQGLSKPGDDDGVVLLDLNLDVGLASELDLGTPVSTKSAMSLEDTSGFETQDVVGGAPTPEYVPQKPLKSLHDMQEELKKAVRALGASGNGGESGISSLHDCDAGAEDAAAGERLPLVKP
ncbi:hypothetical protein M011DRAFT_474822 [Sporormia fimetaria CBS 119925]|uniref:Uncharacterized protein n=1 Tax=Sporormia fimetaria CBS 119925 TaxID=1340428 RepID=A0A6A6VJS3_9PLEO|nr:hypothetical protein M011DRAFT_474822 [Sporormia fimetaria CBS 119925]